MDLLKPRTKFSFGLFEATVFGLYAALAGVLAFRHASWADEAQAWLIARDSGFWELFTIRLHYEGSPGLWHGLLWFLAHVGLPYAAMQATSFAAGSFAVFLMLRFSPFPLLIRALLPFTFPLVFQTAVIARSYSLVPALAFLLCIALTAPRRNPWLVAILAVLLANTSLIAFALAVGLTATLLVPRVGAGLSLRARPRPVPAAAALLLISGLLFAIYTATPAPDMTYGLGAQIAANPHGAQLLSRVTSISPPPASLVAEVKSLPAPSTPPPPPLRWPRSLKRHTPASRIFNGTVNFLSLPFYAVSASNLFALAFYAVLVVWFIRYRWLGTVLPLLAVVIAGNLLHIVEHHTSVVFTALITVLWLGVRRLPSGRFGSLDRLLMLSLAVVSIEQVAWTASAILQLSRQPFDGAVAAAHYLAPRLHSNRIATVDTSGLPIAAYLQHTGAQSRLFYNQPANYFTWKLSNVEKTDPGTIVQSHPDFILDSEMFPEESTIDGQIVPLSATDNAFKPQIGMFFEQRGYHEVARFCGVQPGHFGVSIRVCEEVYAPTLATGDFQRSNLSSSTSLQPTAGKASGDSQR